MTAPFGALSEVGHLERLVLRHAREAFDGPVAIARQWQALRFTALPDFDRACREYDAFAALLDETDVEVRWIEGEPAVGLDSIYVRDASVVTPAGVVLGAMGKAARAGEPAMHAAAFAAAGVPIVGRIEPPGRLEGGDVVWFDDRTVAVGLGYRTNDAGLRQFRQFLGPEVDCHPVPLPHWRGPDDVFHLMSVLSPVDRDLAVVYSPLLPVPFRQWLLDRGNRLVEVPDDEFGSMGTNVLATAPRRCVALAGNPQTRRRLERAGAEVRAYAGGEISLKGGGGPTCLTRPLVRRVPAA